MFRSIKRFVRYYPQQAFLIVYNAGIFTWLKATSGQIVDQLGINHYFANSFPEPVQQLFGQSIETLQNYVSNSPYGWLIASMIAVAIYSFIKGILKFLFFVLIILIGVYLVIQNQELLSQIIY